MMRQNLFLKCSLLSLALGLSVMGQSPQGSSLNVPHLTTARADIEILTTPVDSALIAAAWLQATGRRLAWTGQIQAINMERGTYTASEFEKLLTTTLEASGLEIYHVTDSLDYVRSYRSQTGRSSVLGYGSGSPQLGLGDSSRGMPEPIIEVVKDGPVILINAEIGSVSMGKQNQSGLDFLAALDDYRALNAPSSVALGTGQNLVQNGFTLTAGAQPLSRYVHLLNQTSDYDSMARPRMECLSGQTAIISTGQRVAVPSQTLTASFGGPSTSATITYQNVSLSFEITPVLLPSGRISLSIKQTDDSISGTQVIAGNSVPTIASQKFSTVTVVTQGDCIALGGIRIVRKTVTKSGPSGLSKIPLIGRLFRVHKGDTQDAELVILVTACIRP